MKNFRKYGNKPFNIALIHGGPGAPGEMQPVAEELSKNFGVLEPFQQAQTIPGQVKELKDTLNAQTDIPVTLIGYSWGAFLSFIFTANNPKFVKKLILVSSGPFEEKYAKNIRATRLNRLNKKENNKLQSLITKLNDLSIKNTNSIFEKLGQLIYKADSYDPVPYKNYVIEPQYDTYLKVWKEAQALRENGGLLKLGEKIKCPVVAIHGDYDPHPSDGIQFPLSNILKNFRFILLKCCGHHPWLEKKAKENFYTVLEQEL